MGLKAYDVPALVAAGFFASEQSARFAIRNGHIRAHKLGRRWIVLEEQLLEDLQRWNNPGTYANEALQ